MHDEGTSAGLAISLTFSAFLIIWFVIKFGNVIMQINLKRSNTY